MLLTVTTLSMVKNVLPTSSTEISCLTAAPWDSSTAARAVVLAGEPRTSSTPTTRTKPCGAASDQEQDEDLSEHCFLHNIIIA